VFQFIEIFLEIVCGIGKAVTDMTTDPESDAFTILITLGLFLVVICGAVFKESIESGELFDR
jgi:hypothetical protein